MKGEAGVGQERAFVRKEAAQSLPLDASTDAALKPDRVVGAGAMGQGKAAASLERT